MAKGTNFGGVHSHRDLNLIQQRVDIQPAAPKLNTVDIPGADGSADLSARPAGRVVYHDRTLTWTFALYPGESWHTKHRQVSNALNGRRVKITLDDDPDYYYDGRLTVKQYNTDKLLRQITIEALCSPFLLRQNETRAEVELATEYTTILLLNERKPVIPRITVTTATTLRWGGLEISVSPGSHRFLDIELQEGENLLEAKTVSGAGTIAITYQEGAL
jgi:hypothetical protein